MLTSLRILTIVAILIGCQNSPGYYDQFHTPPAQDPTPFVTAGPPECVDGPWYEIVAASFAVQPQGWDEMHVEAHYHTTIEYFSADNDLPNGCLPDEITITYSKNGVVVGTNSREPLNDDHYYEFDAAGHTILNIYGRGQHVERAAYTADGELAADSWDSDDDGIIRGTKTQLINFDAFLDEQGVDVDNNGYKGENCNRRIEVAWPDPTTFIPPNPPITDECTLTVVANAPTRRFVGSFFPPNKLNSEGFYNIWTIEELDEKGQTVSVRKYRKPYEEGDPPAIISVRTGFTYNEQGEITSEGQDADNDGVYEFQLMFTRVLDRDGIKTTTISRDINKLPHPEPEKLIVTRTLDERTLTIDTFRLWQEDGSCHVQKVLTDFHNLLPCLTGTYHKYAPTWSYQHEYDAAGRPTQATVLAKTNGDLWSPTMGVSEKIVWAYEGDKLIKRSYTNNENKLYGILENEAERRTGDTYYEYDAAGNKTRELYGGPAGIAREWLDIRHQTVTNVN